MLATDNGRSSSISFRVGDPPRPPRGGLGVGLLRAPLRFGAAACHLPAVGVTQQHFPYASLSPPQSVPQY
ncbi:MAG: hypothetical protein NWR72_05670 [Bacteroidia bacterium]|nr:hypothetical protein [Bacteroidia bacterium]